MSSRRAKGKKDYSCPTGKTRYHDPKQAKKSVHTLSNNSMRDSVPYRSYQCEYCNGYHLSSREW